MSRRESQTNPKKAADTVGRLADLFKVMPEVQPTPWAAAKAKRRRDRRVVSR